LKKKQKKGLLELSKQLPESMELIMYGETIRGEDIPEDKIREIDDFSIESNYKFKRRVLLPINHHNRLQKAFARDKEQGLVDYIEWVDANNKKLNSLFDDLKLSEVNQNILEIAKRGAKGFWTNILNFLFAFYHNFINKKVA